MHAEVEDLLRTAKTEHELQNILQVLCEPCGAVVRTDVLAGTDAPSQMMCVVQMADRPGADLVASRFGTTTFGNRLVIFKYEAPADFGSSAW
ncbi:MAG: RNA-binding protein [Rhodocyclaceae bacterium]|nr:RNA-binding protein [Rhodocyclaceae bacterium]